jgi:transglutaminase-like putative cysteine protease
MFWLAGSLTLVVLPHVRHAPLWVVLAFAALALWRVANVAEAVRLPGRFLRVLMSVGFFLSIYFSFGTVFGRDAGVALLIVFCGMKLLETENLRDAFVVAFLGYFLVITNFLYSQSVPTAVYMLMVVLALTATLLALNSSQQGLPSFARVRLACALVIQSLPIALVLFVLFPRIPGPLWGLPAPVPSGNPGLTDTMTPGSISRVSRSEAVAFRVKFEDEPPPPSQRYWRGPVLWHTDGRTWSLGAPEVGNTVPGGEPSGVPVDYTITLEPHDRAWLFALDLPATVPTDSVMTDDFQLIAREPVRTRRRYQVRSYPAYRDTYLSERQRAAGLELPADAHPRARALARRWRASRGDDDHAVVRRALAYFRIQPFYYTLNPPVLTGDTVDAFLFDSRRGFCELYAASFAVLMRAAGIPARIVTGYQGGDMNPLGDYLIVRQRDAHAWVEVWLDGEGWVRVDPTAAVSPDRIELGVDAVIPDRVGIAGMRVRPDSLVGSVWQGLGHGWDAFNNAWNQWVLGYGPERQSQLLARFGLDADDALQLALGLGAAVGVLLGAVSLWLRRRRTPADTVLEAYRSFRRKLGRAGMAPRSTEGPLALARRVSRARPGMGRQVEYITALYVRLRYGAGDGDVRKLQRAVAQFKP